MLITMAREGFDNLEDAMPNLRKKVLLPGAGHWIQQERPTEVNELIAEFLSGLAILRATAALPGGGSA